MTLIFCSLSLRKSIKSKILICSFIIQISLDSPRKCRLNFSDTMSHTHVNEPNTVKRKLFTQLFYSPFPFYISTFLRTIPRIERKFFLEFFHLFFRDFPMRSRTGARLVFFSYDKRQYRVRILELTKFTSVTCRYTYPEISVFRY